MISLLTNTTHIALSFCLFFSRSLHGWYSGIHLTKIRGLWRNLGYRVHNEVQLSPWVLGTISFFPNYSLVNLFRLFITILLTSSFLINLIYFSCRSVAPDMKKNRLDLMTPRSSIRFFRLGATELQLNIFKLYKHLYRLLHKTPTDQKRNWEILDIFDNINSWWHLSKIKFIPQKDGHCLSFCQIWHR